jgi:serine/threonine protein kinase
MAEPHSKQWPDSINGYTIGMELGHGAFACVCSCTKVGEDNPSAIKIFPKDKLLCPEDHERFQREINAMAFLRHDNLLSLRDFFWDDQNYYLVTDLCPGGELFRYIIDHERLDEATAATVFRQIACAIACAHAASVAHRDLKPENILITQFPQVKVGDFGFVGFVSDSQLMKTFCGSPVYCAPECLSHVEYDGRKSDIWSLGVILYAMVTGQLPWNVSNTAQMLRSIMKAIFTIPRYVSMQCRELILSMMCAKPSERITIQKVLEHPWLRLGKSVGRGSLSSRVGGIAPVRSPSLEELTRAASTGSTCDENGIFSPFDRQAASARADAEDADLGRSASRRPPRPSLPPPKPRGLAMAIGVPLGQARQRSARNMLAAGPQQSWTTKLDTISEHV